MIAASVYTRLLRCDGYVRRNGTTKIRWYFVGFRVPRRLGRLLMGAEPRSVRLFGGAPPHVNPRKEIT